MTAKSPDAGGRGGARPLASPLDRMLDLLTVGVEPSPWLVARAVTAHAEREARLATLAARIQHAYRVLDNYYDGPETPGGSQIAEALQVLRGEWPDRLLPARDDADSARTCSVHGACCPGGCSEESEPADIHDHRQEAHPTAAKGDLSAATLLDALGEPGEVSR